MRGERLLLKAGDLKAVLRRYLDRLRQHRDALNRLNVYPVPDGDTGTNMTLTVESVVAETDGAEGMGELAAAMAHGSLMGAQGNSGIILSQILRGLADAFRDEPSVGTAELVEALDRASTAAYSAVGRPVEGTILTVLREAAEAAADTETPDGESLAELLSRVYHRAAQSLEDTPELLPVLKEAGVVDAGGAGFLLLLVAFLEEVTGEDVALPPEIFHAAAVRILEAAAAGDDLTRSIADLRYEVMFLLDSAAPRAGDELREAWAEIGDSIVVVGGDGTWNCHIHTDEIGPAIEAGTSVGRPHRIKITDLLEQAAAEGLHGLGGTSFEPLPAFAGAPLGVVTVAAGDGVLELFRDAGAQAAVVGGQTMNPSVREVLDVVEAVPATDVIVLPNNKNIVPVAEQLDALSTKRVHVVPTRSIPQGLAAMIAYMPGAPPEAAVKGMTEAMGGVATGEVTRAVRDARTPVGAIETGDWLGLVDGTVQVISDAADAAAIAVLNLIVGDDAELVTLIEGAGTTPEETSTVVDWIEAHDLDAEVLGGGQPLYPFLIGVE